MANRLFCNVLVLSAPEYSGLLQVVASDFNAPDSSEEVQLMSEPLVSGEVLIDCAAAPPPARVAPSTMRFDGPPASVVPNLGACSESKHW